LEDDRKFFGAIVERKVLFLLDVSSSMAASLQEMVEALAQLLLQWGACPVHRVKSFNIVTYASTVSKWQEELVPVSGDCCAQAVQWLHEVRAGGASCLLEALKVCLHTVSLSVSLPFNITILTDLLLNPGVTPVWCNRDILSDRWNSSEQSLVWSCGCLRYNPLYSVSLVSTCWHWF